MLREFPAKSSRFNLRWSLAARTSEKRMCGKADVHAYLRQRPRGARRVEDAEEDVADVIKSPPLRPTVLRGSSTRTS